MAMFNTVPRPRPHVVPPRPGCPRPPQCVAAATPRPPPFAPPTWVAATTPRPPPFPPPTAAAPPKAAWVTPTPPPPPPTAAALSTLAAATVATEAQAGDTVGGGGEIVVDTPLELWSLSMGKLADLPPIPKKRPKQRNVNTKEKKMKVMTQVDKTNDKEKEVSQAAVAVSEEPPVSEEPQQFIPIEPLAPWQFVVYPPSEWCSPDHALKFLV